MKYHPYFCEENIWHLCDEKRTGWAIFVSNLSGVYFESQRLQPEGLVWDYHVVYVGVDGIIIDFDHDQGVRTPLPVWLDRSFQHSPPEYAPKFLAIAADDYIRDFSSDRSHMIKNGEWLAPPPPWAPIGSGNSLSGMRRLSSTWMTCPELSEWARLLGLT